MADIIDVMATLRDVVSSIVYPNGTAAPSLTGKKAAVWIGWPNSQSLDAALNAGNSYVSIFPKPMERVTTRYSRDAQVIAMPQPTISAAVSGATVTLSGTISTPQNVALIVNGRGYVHAVQASDTLAAIATALATAVQADVAGTTSSGPQISLGPSAVSVVARVGASGTVATEVGRQERVVMITIWSPNAADRDALARAIDPALRAMNFITLPDGFAARVQYQGSPLDDGAQKATVYRRDLNFLVEYATTITTTAPAVVLPTTTIADDYSANISTRIS